MIRFYINAFLTGIWFCILNFLTFQNGEGTSETSSGMSNVFLDLLKKYLGIEFDPGRFERHLRFAAHPISFVILTVLLLLTVLSAADINLIKNEKKATIIALIFLTAWSLLCEILKIFVPGRHCDAPDAAGNLLGVIIGFGIAYLIKHLSRSGADRP